MKHFIAPTSHLDKKDEILLVCRDSSSRGGVFPVQVEAVQLVLSGEGKEDFFLSILIYLVIYLLLLLRIF